MWKGFLSMALVMCALPGRGWGATSCSPAALLPPQALYGVQEPL